MFTVYIYSEQRLNLKFREKLSIDELKKHDVGHLIMKNNVLTT